MTLRPMAEAERGWFQRQAADGRVMRWLGGPQSAEVSGARFDYMRGLHARYGYTFWLMERRADKAALGICGLKRIDAPAAPAMMADALEIGWRLEPFAWGQGYAREAAAASLAHAFDAVGGEEVYAITSLPNVASWRLMLRLGMTRREDLDFLDPRFADDGPTIVHRITAADWAAVRAQLMPAGATPTAG